jgi:hypothetical protein
MGSSRSADSGRQTQNAFGFYPSIEVWVRVAVLGGLSIFMTSIRSRSPKDDNDHEAGPVDGFRSEDRPGSGSIAVNDPRAKAVPNECQLGAKSGPYDRIVR